MTNPQPQGGETQPWMSAMRIAVVFLSFVWELNPVLVRKPYYEANGGIWFQPRSVSVHGVQSFAITKRSKTFGGMWGFEIWRANK